MKPKNIVAKFARQFNKAKIEPDRKNDYKRKPKKGICYDY